MSKRGFEQAFGAFKRRLDKDLESSKFARSAENDKRTLFSIERQFVRTTILDHKGILDRKFPNLNYKDLTIAVQTILRRNIDKNIGKKGVQWLNPAKTILIANNFNILSKLMTAVRASIRQEARDTIVSTDNKINRADKRNAAATSIVLGGIDPRNISDGGDINAKTDLKKGIIVTSGSNLRKRASGKGFEVGHAFGPGAAALSRILQDPRIEDFFSPEIKLQVSQSLDIIEETEGFFKENIRLFGKSGVKEGTLVVTILESAKSNNVGGTTLSAQKNKVKELRKILDKEKVQIAQQWASAKGSPSMVDLYRNTIVELFLKGKAKPKKRANKAKFKSTRKRSIPVYSPELTPTAIIKKNEDEETDLSSLLGFLNRKLHDKIQQNMGKGRSQQILNYRTGRFARSAKIQNLLPSKQKGSLIAEVKYQRAPYSVFEKGGRMYKPGRDPERIFGRSIRQLLQEEKIAELRRVEVRLRG